jgi:hypothetical protein
LVKTISKKIFEQIPYKLPYKPDETKILGRCGNRILLQRNDTKHLEYILYPDLSDYIITLLMGEDDFSGIERKTYHIYATEAEKVMTKIPQIFEV